MATATNEIKETIPEEKKERMKRIKKIKPAKGPAIKKAQAFLQDLNLLLPVMDSQIHTIGSRNKRSVLSIDSAGRTRIVIL